MPAGYVVVGVFIGISLASLFFIIHEHQRKVRGHKKRREWIDLGYINDWSMPSAEDAVKRYCINLDGNSIEMLSRMQMLHGFENPGMAMRRAISVTVHLDQLLPNGGTVITVDEKGAEVPLELVKVIPKA